MPKTKEKKAKAKKAIPATERSTKVKNRKKKRKSTGRPLNRDNLFDFCFEADFSDETTAELEKARKRRGWKYIGRNQIRELMENAKLTVVVKPDEPIFGGQTIFVTPIGFLNQDGEKPHMKIRKITILMKSDQSVVPFGLSFRWAQNRDDGTFKMETLL